MSGEPGLERFVERLPKAELHVHLEGTIRPATLLDLARRRRVRLPADNADGLERWFRFDDFAHFVDVYLTCSRCLRDPEDFQRVVNDFAAEQERQRVLYSEVHFTIGTHLANGANGGELADALDEARREAAARRGVEIRWITDIVRDLGPARADQTLEWALAASDRGVVALGLSGFEAEPDEPYREHFAVAAAEGLRRVAHAGEHEGPESIRSALALGAERIGHGIRAVDDPSLVEELATGGVPLEVCPTSNVRLGAAPSHAEHPFDRLRRAGVAVTVNSDDPSFFDTTLTAEYLHLAEHFGYEAEELAGLALAALRHSFLPVERRDELAALFAAEIAELGEEHLGRKVEPAEA